MTYKIYDIQDADIWDSYLKKMNISDIHFTKEYLAFNENYGYGKAFLFIYEDSNGIVYYPFLRREIDIKMEDPKRQYYDIASPYGFGGPLVQSHDRNNLIKLFRKSFEEYCNNNNIISEFIRFHPFIGNHSNFEEYIDIVKSGEIIYVDLIKSEEEIWNSYQHNNKKNIKKAARESIEIYYEEGLDSFELFYEIYISTMRRNEANDFYYFNREYFSSLVNYLDGQAMFFYAKKNDIIISAELVIFSKDFIHSFLGGTNEQYFEFRPNNLLKHQIILEAKRRNIKYFVLGGGYSPNDGIFNYKKSFNPDGIKGYYIGKKVLNKCIYDRLTEEWNSMKGYNNDHNEKYFPQYRR